MPDVAGHIGTHHPGTDSRATDPPDFTDVELALGRIKTRIEDDLTRLERVIVGLFDRPLSSVELEDARERCDRLGTTFGGLGFGVSAELLRRTAAVLDHDGLGLPECMSMSNMLEDARIAMSAVIEESRVISSDGPTLAVVGDATDTLDDIMWVAASRGLAITRVVEGMDTGRPDAAAIVLVAGHPDLSLARPLVRGLRERYPRQPLVLVAPEGRIDDRLAVTDLITTLMPRTARPAAIVDEIRAALARTSHDLSVAVFGDQSDWVAEELIHRGMTAEPATTPDDVLAWLRNGTARSALLLPGATPAPNEMLRAIRTDRSLRSTIVGVVADDDDHRDSALRLGADAFFTIVTDIDDVALTLKARLVRRGEIEPLGEPDQRQRSLPWANASILLERMLSTCFRQNAPMGLGIVRLPFDIAGSELDDHIATEFRQDDVVARRNNDILVVALRGVSRRTIHKRLQDIHNKFSLSDLGVRSVGSEFPVDGRSLSELLVQGQIALARIEAADGPIVSGADWQPEAVDASDVVIVDPDDTLAAVLVPTLERRGLRARHESDSLIALEHLTGRSAVPLPSVVLMELDLEGFDGLHFLRQMRESGTLARVSVIVLTARASENDLRQAFDLGATDYVTKPFSTPLLMHRLERAVDRR